MPKDQLSDCSNPHTTSVQLKYTSGGLVSYSLYGATDKPATDKPAIIFPKNSCLGSAPETDMLTNASGPQRHHVLAEVSGHVW